MPPTSRGILLLRTSLRTPAPQPRCAHTRHVSFKRPTKIPEALRPQPPKPPTPQPAAAAKPTPPPPRPPHWLRRLFASLRRNRALRWLSLVLLWAPIAFLGVHHFPFEYKTIEGPSMQPTLNPDYTKELGTLNTVTHAIMLKQDMIPSSLSDLLQWFSSTEPTQENSTTLRRGQIVAYRSPFNPERVGVKRVVGVPGDRVTPLPGYPGGSEAVIVPFHHLWLEGDVCDRARSLDSNTFGPVSANLVLGTIVGVWRFFPLYRRLRWEEQSYPGQNRVEKDVARQEHPDDVVRRAAFLDGRAAEDLRKLKAYSLERKLLRSDRERLERMLERVRQEKERKDTETYELANELEAELRAKLSVKMVQTKLKNVEMSKEEFQAFQKDQVVPEAVLARSNVGGDT